MKKHTWKILVLVLLIAGAIVLTRQIVKANTGTDSTGTDNTGTGTDTSSKLLGSAATSAFAKDQKIYADSSALRVRSSPSLTGNIVKNVDAGTYIGMTTGNESNADNLTWVEVTLADASKAYVAKNYTYILP